jgi:hypothetical protein
MSVIAENSEILEEQRSRTEKKEICSCYTRCDPVASGKK